MEKFNVYNSDITREKIICEVDSREVYKITYNNGEKDLVNILSQDLYINLYSILNNEYFKLDTKHFIELWNNGNIQSVDIL